MWEAVCIAIERQSSAFAGNRTILGGCVHLRHSYGVGLITVLLILAAALVGARLLSGAGGATLVVVEAVRGRQHIARRGDYAGGFADRGGREWRSW